jgi:hypothetical protein
MRTAQGDRCDAELNNGGKTILRIIADELLMSGPVSGRLSGRVLVSVCFTERECVTERVVE